MDINSIFSERLNTTATVIIDILAFGTVLVACLLIYLILFQTPTVMKTYKKYLLIHVILTIVNALIITAGKPVIVNLVSIGICTGFFPIQNEFLTRLFLALWINSIVWLSTALTLIHVERYFTIHKRYDECNCCCWRMTSIVIYYVIFNIVISLALIIISIYGDLYLGGSAVQAHLREKVIGGMDFFQKYPGAIVLNNDYSSPWVLSFYGCLLLVVVSTSPPLCIFLSLNVLTGFKMINMGNFPERTRKIQITVLRTSIIQVFLVSVLGIIPALLLVAIIASSAQLNINMQYLLAIFQSHPLIDNLVVILFIKPYREFMLRWMRGNSIKASVVITKIS